MPTILHNASGTPLYPQLNNLEMGESTANEIIPLLGGMIEELRENVGDYDAIKQIQDSYNIAFDLDPNDVLETGHVRGPSKSILHDLDGNPIPLDADIFEGCSMDDIPIIISFLNDVKKAAGNYEAVKQVFENYGLDLNCPPSKVLEAQGHPYDDTLSDPEPGVEQFQETATSLTPEEEALIEKLMTDYDITREEAIFIFECMKENPKASLLNEDDEQEINKIMEESGQ